ncbi:up-regulator of cell proliferation-like [Hyperolius riggenbachi]|uniref:up-regulator of cell proliferation-like n=1 Tax=Hyperolius riggenbachi TaxID=752182 RepID=UPI0035A2D8EF
MCDGFPALMKMSPQAFNKRQDALHKMLSFHETSKISLKDVLEIGTEHLTVTSPQSIDDIPMHFLKKILSLNKSARNTQVIQNNNHEVYFDEEENEIDALHPLDVLCALLHCSDHFLQQEIVTKLSTCQFAVPLLLPAVDGSPCTLILWAMRDIVKRWKPQSLAASKEFREDNLVNIAMPIFSFVRLGRSEISKSEILNKVVSKAHYNDFFIHGNMDCGNIKREISDGLVEITWYFPGGSSETDSLPEPFGITNLRGDLNAHFSQFSFLTQVSSAVFIFVENVGEEQVPVQSNYNKMGTEYVFIVTDTSKDHAQKLMEKVFPLLDITKSKIVIKERLCNDATLAGRIQNVVKNNLENPLKKISLENLAKIACEFGFKVDESSHGCGVAESRAEAITGGIKEVTEYKQTTLKLQGELWKQLTALEKEFCKRKQQGNEDQETYETHLTKQCSELHQTRNQQSLSEGMLQFISAVSDMSSDDRQFFLKWMKFKLDSLTRTNIYDLQAKYEQLLKDENKSLARHDELKQLDQKLCDSALGVEHFMRELGQLYEAEFHALKDEAMTDNVKKINTLPGIAADLLLEGFPLELIDGDASNIPLQWVTDVLKEVDKKTGGQCKIRVITVLGVQSSGKSTLLNTMFGLQFPVASGRCTKGAFMTLLKVKDRSQEELDCDFILVIDTEGLKAPELASLEDNYEHDNELATLVIGLSDITILNISNENTDEVKDILQIAIHAFLRMKDIKRKPNVQFVHQNVSDVSAHEKTLRGRTKLLDLISEITELAAKMEKRGKVTFNDIMTYDLNDHNWYIPGLWQGVPPMASISYGYCTMVFNLKKHLLENIKKMIHPDNNARSIWDFLEWIKTLWSAVKHESFIFSFRNSLVAEAYNKLCIEYSRWEWSFRKQVHRWLTETETTIKNTPLEKLPEDTSTHLELENVLRNEEATMQDLLKTYFNRKSENVHLVQRYNKNFCLDIACLCNELRIYATSKLADAIRIQKGKCKIQKIKDTLQNTMEAKVTSLLLKCKEEKSNLGGEQLKKEFDAMWRESSSELKRYALAKQRVNKEMLQQLKQNMNLKANFIMQQLLRVKNLADYKRDAFELKDNHFENWVDEKTFEDISKHECYERLNEFATSLVNKCKDYVALKIGTKEDFDETYSRELLTIADTEIIEQDVARFHITDSFEFDIKLQIMGNAVEGFQMMHDTFIQENDPVVCLERLKPHYFSVFESIYQKDESQHRAKELCELGLKPAVRAHISQHLGEKLLDDFLQSSSEQYGSRTIFQFTVLKKLLLDMNFREYTKYINSYEEFVQKWICKDLENKYEGSEKFKSFQIQILETIMTKILTALKQDASVEGTTVSDFLTIFSTKLQNDLVISQDVTRMVLFLNTSNIGQFAEDVERFLPEIHSQLEWEIKSSSFQSVLSNVTLKPEHELFRKVIGCRKHCPFCKVPCEAGGVRHAEHFSSLHRPKGLAKCTWKADGRLATSTCSADVISIKKFQNEDTGAKPHPYRDYRDIYPDWNIEGDLTECSDYWKYVFQMLNEELAVGYIAEKAELPEDWRSVTEEDAMRCLKLQFNMNKE